MKPDGTRVSAPALLAAVALVAAAAIRLGPFGSGTPAAPEPPSTAWVRVDTLGWGESLGSLLSRSGLSPAETAELLRAARPLDARRIPAGTEVRFAGDTATNPDDRPLEITLQLSRDRAFRLSRSGESWSGYDEPTRWVTDTLVVHGVVRSNLYDALDAGAAAVLPKGARTELAWSIADVYEYKVDMSRDLQDGDTVRVLFERRSAPSGAVKIGAVLAAGLERGGAEMQAIRYDRTGPRGARQTAYYDQDGRSLRAGFLRAPLSFRRISSRFGLRRHPILGGWRAHRGTDHAAASGTPVRAIGDGVVVFAGRNGGYGNAVDVRHANGFVSRYGHLSSFAAGVRAGARVTMGGTIGRVGMTGLATAPHLHFEVLVGGVQRDPRVTLKPDAGPPLPPAERPRFERARLAANAALARPTTPARVSATAP